MLQNFVPRFLKKADQYLLKNHPVIWRTKIHFVAFYSLILGNVGVIGLGLLHAKNLEELSKFEMPEHLFIFCNVLAGLGLICWGYSQYKIKLQASNFSAYLLTGFIYLVGTISIWYNGIHLKTTIQYQIANLVEKDQLQRDWETIEPIKFGENLARPLGKKNMIHTRYKVNNYSENPYLQFRANNVELRNKVIAVKQARHLLDQYPNYFSNRRTYSAYTKRGYQNLYIIPLLGFLFIPLNFLLLSKLNFVEFFTTLFFQVILSLGSVLMMSIVNISSAPAPSFLTVLLILFAVFYTKNKSLSVLVFSTLASAITITLFFDHFMYVDPTYVFFKTLLFFGFVGTIMNTAIVYFMHQRSTQPIIN